MPQTGKTRIADLNKLERGDFVAIVGPVFEHSPWIADRTWPRRPFAGAYELLGKLCATVNAATDEEKLSLLHTIPISSATSRAKGKLTARIDRRTGGRRPRQFSADEVSLFERYNAEYREQFGFPVHHLRTGEQEGRDPCPRFPCA